MAIACHFYDARLPREYGHSENGAPAVEKPDSLPCRGARQALIDNIVSLVPCPVTTLSPHPLYTNTIQSPRFQPRRLLSREWHPKEAATARGIVRWIASAFVGRGAVVEEGRRRQSEGMLDL